MSDWESSLLLPDGLEGLLDSGAALLPVDHDLEALDVGKVGASSPLGELLGEGSGSPLALKLGSFGGLHEGAGAGAASDRELHPGKGQSLHWQNHSWEVLALDEGTGLVRNVDDGDLLAVVLTVVNETNSAWLNEVLVTLQMTKKGAVSFDSYTRFAGHNRKHWAQRHALWGGNHEPTIFFFSINYIK